MEQNRPPQRQVNPVRPTFFLQERHLFFFFLPSLSPLSPESAPPIAEHSSLCRVGTVVPAVSRLPAAAAAEAQLAAADTLEPKEEEELLDPSSMERLAILPGVGASEAGMLVGGACFFLTCSL